MFKGDIPDPHMDHDGFIKHLLADERAQACLKAALERKAAGTILPIGEHITPELLELVYPELAGWMIDVVQAHNTKEPDAVLGAINGAEHFKNLLKAAIWAVEEAPMNRNQALVMHTTLMLMCGWKLAERAMDKLAERAAAV
jgi:hypothetical protein